MGTATVLSARTGPVLSPDRRDTVAAGALAVAGVLFVAYPALRPYSDESTLDGAAALSSTAWVVAHLLAMAAFVLLALGLARALPRGRSGRTAVVTAWLGTALILPYYGVETFGLQVIAQRALDDGDASLLALADTLHTGGIAVVVFGAGLVLLAVAGAALGLALWSGGGVVRLGGLLAGSGLVLYVPQYFAPGGLRIAHGVILGVGLVLLAAVAWRTGTRALEP